MRSYGKEAVGGHVLGPDGKHQSCQGAKNAPRDHGDGGKVESLQLVTEAEAEVASDFTAKRRRRWKQHRD